MAMIPGSWDKTKLVCGNHPHLSTPPEMEMAASAHMLFYACTKCEAHMCDEDETPCKNRLSSYEYEHMLNHLASVIAEAEANDEFPNLRNYSWKRKSCEFRVLEHDGDKMTVSVRDKALCP